MSQRVGGEPVSQRLGCQGTENFDLKGHNQVLISVHSSVLELWSRMEKENIKDETRGLLWRTDCIQAEILLSLCLLTSSL